MIELRLMHRMVRRGLLATPLLVVALGVAGGLGWALSGAIGAALGLGNLWLGGRVLGGIAENRPELLMGAGLAVLAIGLSVLTGAALALREIDYLSFPITGVTLVGVHLFLVTWEAADAFLKIPSEHASESKELVHGS